MSSESIIVPIDIKPGCMPITDGTPSDVPCWVETFHVRFDPTTGRLRKLDGWVKQNIKYNKTISGYIRTLWSGTLNQRVYSVLGTNYGVYSLLGAQLDNITPLKTSSTAIANSLATHYGTLGNNPISTVTGSNVVTVTDPDASRYQVNDTYTLSGSSSVNGIPSGEINGLHSLISVSSSQVTFSSSTNATSTGSGGGASVVRSDGLIRVTKTAHGMVNGDRVKLSGALAAGGITALQINQEFEIRNVAANTFDVFTAGTSTSSVSSAGGASTVYFQQVDAGPVNQGGGVGYGVGLYGVGLYGSALESSTGETYPQIWFIDRFGENVILTAGNSSKIYSWDANVAVAPTVISGAPTDINYAFVSDNILVTFGSGQENNIKTSDVGNVTQWTASSTNQVFEDVIEGAGRLISHCPIDTANLIFTETQTYYFKYTGAGNGSLIWSIRQIDPNIGIIGPLARVSVGGIAFWMSSAKNFYMYRGGRVEIVPSNLTDQSTVLRYVFDNLNYSQRYKIFAWYNEDWNEVWFHYPSANSLECDRVARYSIGLKVWSIDSMLRTAGEWPAISLSNPRLASVSDVYVHNAGNDDNGQPMEFSAKTKMFCVESDRTNRLLPMSFIPDNNMSGNVTVTLSGYSYPAQPSYSATASINHNSSRQPIQGNFRYWQYTISGNELGQSFLMGQWAEELTKSSRAP